MWKVAQLRITKTQRQAKTGDNDKHQLITKRTLVARNGKSSGIVA